MSTTIICSLIVWFIAILFIEITYGKKYRLKEQKQEKEKYNIELKKEYVKPFSVSAYIDRIEKAWIEIMQEREKEPKAEFVLWLGLDGLRLNDDGTSEWISRREPKPLDTGVFSQPLNMQNAVHYGCIGGAGTGGTGVYGTIATIRTMPYDYSQSTRANIDRLIGQIDTLQTQQTIGLNMQMMDLQAQAKHEYLMRMMHGCCWQRHDRND